MGKYSKKVSLQRKVLTIACVALGVLLALLLVLLACLNRDKAPEVSVPETTEATAEVPTEEATQEVTEAAPEENALLVESVKESGDTVTVVTTYVTVKYPFAFSDLVSVEAVNSEGSVALEFGANIGQTTHKAYTLYFNGEGGMPIGTLQRDEETYVVTAQFHDVTGLDKDDMTTFYAAQETFNDVVNSLAENRGFTAAD